MQQATAADPTLQTLLQTVKSGWPDHNVNLPTDLLPYTGTFVMKYHMVVVFSSKDEGLYSAICLQKSDL